jgi:hypothetical protein
VHGSSLLQSKDSKTVAAARSQEVAHGSGRHSQEGVNDDTAGSPELHQQVGLAFGCHHVACTALQGISSCCGSVWSQMHHDSELILSASMHALRNHF